MLIQLVMVALVIGFPDLVGWGLDRGPEIDSNTIQIPVPGDADDQLYWPEGTEVPGD